MPDAGADKDETGAKHNGRGGSKSADVCGQEDKMDMDHGRNGQGEAADSALEGHQHASAGAEVSSPAAFLHLRGPWRAPPSPSLPGVCLLPSSTLF